MKNRVIVGLGEILWDTFADRKVLGGAPANFAYHVSQFGYDGYAVSAIGKDKQGERIEAELQDRQLKYILEKTDYPTGKVLVELDEQGVPEYEIIQDVAWDNIPFSESIRKLAESTDAVCFGTLGQRSEVSRKTIEQFLHTMPAEKLKIFDINLRQHFYSKEIIEASLSSSNILKINDEEIGTVAELFRMQTTSEQDICRFLLTKYELKVLILTKGANGSYVFTHKETSYLPTPTVKVADTVGAGDAFTAAFIASYIQGKTLIKSHKLAVDVSAYVCTCHGAMPALSDIYKQKLSE